VTEVRKEDGIAQFKNSNDVNAVNRYTKKKYNIFFND
jgi:hypothetical protein